MEPNLNDKKDKFYFRGCYYDSFEELTNASIKFNSSKISTQSMEELGNMFLKDFIANINIRKIDITNGSLKSILQQGLSYMLNLADIYQEKEKDE